MRRHTRCLHWMCTVTRSNTSWSPTRILGLVESTSTASTLSTIPGSRVSSKWQIWFHSYPFRFFISFSLSHFWVSLKIVSFCFLFQTINLAAICTPADYNTRPLDTIYSNFIDALPVVRVPFIYCYLSLFACLFMCGTFESKG